MSAKVSRLVEGPKRQFTPTTSAPGREYRLLTPSACLLFLFSLLIELVTRQDELHQKIIHPRLHSPDPGLSRAQVRSLEQARSPTLVAGVQVLGPLLFQARQQGAGLEVEYLGLTLVPAWAAGGAAVLEDAAPQPGPLPTFFPPSS